MIYLVLIGIAVAVIYYFVVRSPYKAIWKDLDGVGIAKHEAQFKHKAVTPRGCEILSTVAIPERVLTIIDRALADQIRRSRIHYPHWKQYGKESDYIILFVEPRTVNRVTEPGSPALVVRPGVQTAGTVIGAGPYQATERPYIVLPHQQNQQWMYENYLEGSVSNEGEHVNALNDWAVFSRHATVEGHYHPMYPDAELIQRMYPDCHL